MIDLPWLSSSSPFLAPCPHLNGGIFLAKYETIVSLAYSCKECISIESTKGLVQRILAGFWILRNDFLCRVVAIVIKYLMLFFLKPSAILSLILWSELGLVLDAFSLCRSWNALGLLKSLRMEFAGNSPFFYILKLLVLLWQSRSLLRSVKIFLHFIRWNLSLTLLCVKLMILFCIRALNKLLLPKYVSPPPLLSV